METTQSLKDEKLPFAATWIDLEYDAKWNKSDEKGQEPYDFIHMWYIKQKTTNKLIDTENSMVVTRGESGWGKIKRIKGIKYMMMKGDQTLGGEHTMVYTDNGL